MFFEEKWRWVGRVWLRGMRRVGEKGGVHVSVETQSVSQGYW